MGPIKSPTAKRFQAGLAGAIIILMLLIGCSLTGCSGGGGGGSAASATTPSPTPTPAPVTPNVTPTDPNGEGLPNDLRLHVEAAFPNSAKERASVFQLAKELQKVPSVADDKNASLAVSRAADRALECMHYILGSDRAIQESRLMESLVFNTEDLTRSYLKYNDNLGGEVFSLTPYDQMKNSCTFNPEALPN